MSILQFDWQTVSETCPDSLLEWAQNALGEHVKQMKFISRDDEYSHSFFDTGEEHGFHLCVDRADVLTMGIHFDELGLKIQPVYDVSEEGWTVVVFDTIAKRKVHISREVDFTDLFTAMAYGAKEAFEIRQKQIEKTILS
jgi:hypothetical protein